MDDIQRAASLFILAMSLGPTASVALRHHHHDDELDFEREELSRSSSEDAQVQVQVPAPMRCEIAVSMLKQMRDNDEEMGAVLMDLLENAEAQSEGYYVATASALKRIHETRMENLRLHNDLVAHHQRSHAFCATNTATRNDLESANRRLTAKSMRLEQEIGSLRTEIETLEQTASQAESAYKNRLECLTVQFEHRDADYRSKLQTLRAELSEEKQKQTEHRRLISFLNKKLRGVVKQVREGGHPKCHVLGTYDDVLGAPV